MTVESSGSEGLDHTPGSGMGGLVFPHAHDRPTVPLQSRGLLAVARLVDLDLGGPVLRVGERPGAVLGAPVPEATVHKYSDASAREDDVRPDRTSIGNADREIDAEPTPGSVK